MITVYYDGHCGLCQREITYYQSQTHNDLIRWQDVNKSEFTRADGPIGMKALLMHLHVEQDGQYFRGVDAFIIIWQQIPGWQWLARLLAIGPVKIIARLFYEIFAQARFYAYAHCRLHQ